MTEIKGYKSLSEQQLRYISILKELEQNLLLELKGIAMLTSVDKRWVSIARSHFEQGFMGAVRAVAQPETIEF